jgi:ATP-dependent protease HslVU (ClpYQ) peptidase subunit
MTCIVGLVDGGKVYIGGDSAGVGGYSLTLRADRKVFRNGDFIMGFTSSFRMGQLLAHAFTPPKRHPDTDVYKFMVTDFINAVRDCLKSGGYAEKHNEAESGGTFLVGYAGRLFKVESDYQVGEPVENFDACGCGEDIALGALFASQAGAKPQERLKTALKAAERFSAGVRGPFHFEEAA